MKKKKIITVVGTRPNFVKAAPLTRVFAKEKNVRHQLCHTGQHFDREMSALFFKDLGLPEPGHYLGVSGGTQAEQLSGIMKGFEKVIIDNKPDLVIVVGDVNSTLAAAVIASRHNIPLAHVEAGLRSHDKSMPEEINRILTDHLADYLFTTEEIAGENLRKEGIPEEKVYFCGNVMIDSLIDLLPEIEGSDILNRLQLQKGAYILSTFHRPANVEEKEFLQNLLRTFRVLAKKKEIVFPLHPRTKKNLQNFGLHRDFNDAVRLLSPLAYIEFLALAKNAALVITDSGGIQEETTYLGVPCITVRDNTERPVTISEGTNILAGRNMEKVEKQAVDVLSGHVKTGKIPELWDGRAAQRIAEILLKRI